VHDASLHELFLATAHGRLDDHLSGHPEILTGEVADLLKAVLQHNQEAGDLRSAQCSAAAAREVLFGLGQTADGIKVYADYLHTRLDRAGDGEDYGHLRGSAMELATHCSDSGWHDGMALTWALAARCSFQAAGQNRPPTSLAHLLQALRDCADVLEAVAEHPLGPNSQLVLGRLAVLLGSVADQARAEEWPPEDWLTVLALLRRNARAGERVIARPVVRRQLGGDETRSEQLEQVLVRLFTEHG
jgi:hypothetical protein